MMTEASPATRPARRITQAFSLAIVGFMMLTALAVGSPAADAQILEVQGWEVVTKPCAAPYVLWPSGLEGEGTPICYDANPYFDGADGDQGAFGCGGYIDGQWVHGDANPYYDINQFPYIEVMLGCYYYPGINIVPTYAPPTYWTPAPTIDWSNASSFTFSL